MLSVQLPAATALADIPFANLRDIDSRGFPFAFTGISLFQLVLRTARRRRRRMFTGPRFSFAARLLFSIRHDTHLNISQR
jgi:FPC/CPF motif-containing protein YcgG